MSIKAYCGRMGSGKTYEVASVVILSALARGRRVVSNIAGLNYQAFVDLITAQGVEPEKIGQLVAVSHDQVQEATFWRTDDPEKEYFIQPGDLVVLDEVWRFWGAFAEKSMPQNVMNFFRMHRHFTHPETGVACDVALITQSVADIARRVRSVIEETYVMTKHTALGSTKRYRVDIFSGGKTTGKPIRQLQRTYEAKYFDLYKSHSQAQEGGAGPKEENIDGRGNLLKGVLFRVVIPLALLCMFVAIYILYGFFHPKDKKQIPPQEAKTTGKVTPVSAPAGAVPPVPLVPGVSQDWRIVGVYHLPRGVLLQLWDGVRNRYVFNPPAVKFTPMMTESILPDGSAVTTWSGSRLKAVESGAASRVIK